MQVHVVAVGRIRDATLRPACDQYLARAGRYFSITVHEVGEAGRRGASAAATRRLETERLAARAPDGTVRIPLARAGRSLTSRQFAGRLRDWRDQGRDLAFFIGGAWGLEDTFLRTADLTLAIAPFTVAHEVARLILFEQLYRAGTILRGEPYHKGDA